MTLLKCIAILLWISAIGPISHADSAASSELRWYRGNTHTHTLNNDGNATPDVVVRWYREHGYQFVFITEHEFLTPIEGLNALYGAEDRFLVMLGQEVTQILADEHHPEGLRHAHVNALGSNRLVMPLGSERGPLVARGVTMSETYLRNFAAIRAAGGIPQVNHPNFRWSVIPSDLAAVSGPFLLEVWNGHPTVSNLGGINDQGESAPSAEGFWDAVLSQGKTVWAVGSDDSHDYLHLDDMDSERPGKAWIMVRAPQLSSAAILDAIESGEFYASNGVVLEDYAADGRSMALTIKQPRGPRSMTQDRRFTTRFIGKDGRLLAEVGGLEPSYKIRGDEGYVRASVIDSNGLRAWTQPVFLTPGRRQNQ